VGLDASILILGGSLFVLISVHLVSVVVVVVVRSSVFGVEDGDGPGRPSIGIAGVVDQFFHRPVVRSVHQEDPGGYGFSST
jgi:hypothetical protein